MSDLPFDEEVELRPEQDEFAGRYDVIRMAFVRLWTAVGDADALLDVEDLTLVDWCRSLAGLQQVKRDAADLEQQLKDAIGNVMSGKTEVIDGFGVVHRSKRKARTRWDTDQLRSKVIGAPLTDPETGEIESPLDCVLAVWNLGAPRTTALRERDLDPDDFCSTEDKPGWDIRVEAGA